MKKNIVAIDGEILDNVVGERGFHAREEQKDPVRAIVEGDLFLLARSSFFFLLSSFFFFSDPESCLNFCFL